MALARAGAVHAFAHVTGGGLAGNLARVLPAHLDAVVDRGTWTPPAVFELIRRVGDVAPDQLELTFNMGIGMVAIVAAADVESASHLLHDRGVDVVRLGHTEAGSGRVIITGDHSSR
jgi:phosphoribosylformylglycinamidine cyclo-ligase